MSWRDGTTYGRDHDFTRQELEPINNIEIYRWAKFRVYGDADADENMSPPIHYRANSVLAWKRAISYSMVNRNMPWNEIAQVGNPTRSQEMQRLIAAMRRFQTQRRGVANQARRALTNSEYERLIEAYWWNPNKQIGLCGAAEASFQLNMIGRGDDCAKWRTPDLRPYDLFPNFGYLARMCWSKNVREERDAPLQIVFGAMDTRYCAVANVAVWTEFNYLTNSDPDLSEYVFSVDGLDDPVRIKERISNLMNSTLTSATILERPGLVGTHSLRKLAVTFARNQGMTKVSCVFVCFNSIDRLSFRLILF